MHVNVFIELINTNIRYKNQRIDRYDVTGHK